MAGEVEDQVWWVSFLDFDPRFFDQDEGRAEPAPNPFVPEKVSTMYPESSVNHGPGIDPRSMARREASNPRPSGSKPVKRMRIDGDLEAIALQESAIACIDESFRRHQIYKAVLDGASQESLAKDQLKAGHAFGSALDLVQRPDQPVLASAATSRGTGRSRHS